MIMRLLHSIGVILNQEVLLSLCPRPVPDPRVSVGYATLAQTSASALPIVSQTYLFDLT